MAVCEQAAGNGRHSTLECRLVSVVEDYYDIPHNSVRDERRRNGDISKARWAVAHVLINDVGYTPSRIARFLNKDHKAVAYGEKKAKLLLRNDSLFFDAVMLLRKEVTPNVLT